MQTRQRKNSLDSLTAIRYHRKMVNGLTLPTATGFKMARSPSATLKWSVKSSFLPADWTWISSITANWLLEKLPKDGQRESKDMAARWMAVFQGSDLPNIHFEHSSLNGVHGKDVLQDDKQTCGEYKWRKLRISLNLYAVILKDCFMQQGVTRSTQWRLLLDLARSCIVL